MNISMKKKSCSESSTRSVKKILYFICVCARARPRAFVRASEWACVCVRALFVAALLVHWCTSSLPPYLVLNPDASEVEHWLALVLFSCSASTMPRVLRPFAMPCKSAISMNQQIMKTRSETQCVRMIGRSFIFLPTPDCWPLAWNDRYASFASGREQ